MDIDIKKYGPLGALIGTWECNKGEDIAPDNTRGVELNKYRERMIFTPMGAVNNHEQEMYGLRYSTTAWRIGEENAFHEDMGYWLWDAKNKQVIKCFTIPRGMALMAGGTVEENATEIKISAEQGSPIYGICSNPFLDKEFKTIRFDLKISIHQNNSFSYEQDTQIKIKGQDKIFHHTDKNYLIKLNNA
jgi:hypothetical protein